MKHKRILALALLSAMPCAFAQSDVPSSMSYQGLIGDANGNLVGSPAPVNRTVIFRVWDNPTATAPANLLYSEQQIVTIANGEFNVLVGQGLTVPGEEAKKVAFDSVFNGTERYLGVTVDDGTAALDPEIAPRQQLLSLPFAFRAKTAEGVANNSITSSMLAAGAVTADSIAPNAIDSSKLAAGAVTAVSIAPGVIDNSKLADGAVTTASIAPGAINSSKLADGVVTAASIAANAVDSSKLAAGAVTNASIPDNTIASSKLTAASVTSDKLALPGIWSAAGGNVSRPSGRVGIGTASPGSLLNLNEPNRNASGRGNYLWMTGVSKNATDMNHGIILALGDNNFPTRTLTISDSTGIIPDGQGGGGTGVRLLNFTTYGDQISGYGTISTGSGSSFSRSNLSFNPFGGNVGIGIFNPQAKLHVDGGAIFGREGSSLLSNVFAANSGSFSDARAKNIVARSKPSEDLEMIRKLQVTDYQMIGRNAPGDAVQKGFIAQEVREIMPEVVMESKHSFVPSINVPATHAIFDSGSKSLRIGLEKAHGLKLGDTVQLQGEKRSWEVKVAETIDDTTFVAGPVEAPISEVFVVGKKVDDFLSVDYGQIFTAGIGAIQQLASQVDAIKTENAGRSTKISASGGRFAELRAAGQACDAKLDAIEKILNSSSGVVAHSAAENKPGANQTQ